MIFTEGTCAKEYEYIPFVPNYKLQTYMETYKVKTNPEVISDIKCPYCNEQPDLLMRYSNDGMVYIHRDRFILVDAEGIAATQIIYCPMCGREL